jgi:transposase
MPRARKYPEELVGRGVRLVFESGRPIAHIAAELGLPSETLRKKVRQAEADQGLRPDVPSTAERVEIKELSAVGWLLLSANGSARRPFRRVRGDCFAC